MSGYKKYILDEAKGKGFPFPGSGGSTGKRPVKTKTTGVGKKADKIISKGTKAQQKLLESIEKELSSLFTKELKGKFVNVGKGVFEKIQSVGAQFNEFDDAYEIGFQTAGAEWTFDIEDHTEWAKLEIQDKK